MDRCGFQGRRLIAAVGLVGTLVVLAVQLITPSPVMLSLEGVEATQVGQYFTYADVSLIVVSAILCGASGTWLLASGTVLREFSTTSTAQHYATSNHDTTDDHDTTTQHPTGDSDTTDTGSSDGTPPDPEPYPQDRWEQAVDRLRNNEETIYALLVKADGKLPQREIVESTDLSKATVSRTLDKLEQKDLVERKPRGMGNVVHLE